MAKHDLGVLIWQCITDKSLGDKLCEILQSKGINNENKELMYFLRFTVKVGLSPSERDYLIKKAKDVCHCLEHCRGVLDVKYDYEGGGDDPKRC